LIPNLVAFSCILILYGGLDEGSIDINFPEMILSIPCF
jgi:hypothetical protein